MESEEGPAAAAAAAAASSSPPSPPSHPDASPVGSPDHALDDVHALLSDDDHDHDLGHGDDGVQEEDPAAGAGVGLTEDLKRKIIKQASPIHDFPFFYFIIIIFSVFGWAFLHLTL